MTESHRKLLDNFHKLEAENRRLKEKCDKQATILISAFPEKSGSFFITGASSGRDKNGLPEVIHVCPSYGSDVLRTYRIEILNVHQTTKGEK